MTSGQRGGAKAHIQLDRVQSGIWVGRKLLKVLKALAAYYDLSAGELVEYMLLATLAGRVPLDAAAQAKAAELMRFYGLELDVATVSPLAPRGTGPANPVSPSDAAE